MFFKIQLKIDVLEKFREFHNKAPVLESLFIKVADPVTLLWLQNRFFPAKFSKFLRTPFYRTSPVVASENIQR